MLYSKYLLREKKMQSEEEKLLADVALKASVYGADEA